MAKAAAAPRIRRRERKNITSGVAHVNASFNNTVVTITDAVVRPGPARIGQRVTLRPRSVDPRQQRSGRQELHRRYAARRSWLSGGSAPAPRRRDVPLDVVIAAAE